MLLLPSLPAVKKKKLLLLLPLLWLHPLPHLLLTLLLPQLLRLLLTHLLLPLSNFLLAKKGHPRVAFFLPCTPQGARWIT